MVRNPVRKDVVHKVRLDPKNIDLLLLMTKNPRPLIQHMDELVDSNIKIGLQVTITPYGKEIEPGIKDKADVAEAFREISETIGKERIIWRYDPVIINDRFDINYHSRKFETLCRELSGHTEQCTFSFVDIYDKLKRFSERGYLRDVSENEIKEFGKAISRIADDHGIKMNMCCARYDLSEYGIRSRGCIDREYMRSLNVPFEEMSVPLREGCKCVRNIDIGEYDTCDHDCIYCYANRNTSGARKKRTYDPKGEMLYGHLSETDTVVELSGRKNSKITDF